MNQSDEMDFYSLCDQLYYMPNVKDEVRSYPFCDFPFSLFIAKRNAASETFCLTKAIPTESCVCIHVFCNISAAVDINITSFIIGVQKGDNQTSV